MKIVRTLAEVDCPNGIDCPKVYLLDDGSVLVRGYVPPSSVLDELGLPANESALIIPPDGWKETSS